MQVNPDVGSMDAVLDKLYGKVGTNKSYISRIEKGALEPGVGLFFLSLIHISEPTRRS